MLLMNVRSYTFPVGQKAARSSGAEVNPNGIIIAGGMHATVAPHEMLDIDAFDHVVGTGEETILGSRSKGPGGVRPAGAGRGRQVHGRVADDGSRAGPNRSAGGCSGAGSGSAAGAGVRLGPGPVATIITSRAVRGSASSATRTLTSLNMGRKPVEQVIDELNYLDPQVMASARSSSTIPCSSRTQKWLREWIEQYPRKTRRWTYWAAGAPTRCASGRISSGAGQGDELAHDLHRLRVGQRSHPATAQQGVYRGGQLLRHRPGQTASATNLEAKGEQPPKFWSNIMRWAFRARRRRMPSRPCACWKRMKRLPVDLLLRTPIPARPWKLPVDRQGKA